jgi:hypothetical protein
MFQYVKKFWYWFINLLSNNKPKDDDLDKNKINNKINIISCKVRYIKENKNNLEE